MALSGANFLKSVDKILQCGAIKCQLESSVLSTGAVSVSVLCRFVQSNLGTLILILLTCLALTGTRNGQASSCFSISARIMRHGAMSLDDCFRLACGRTSSLGGGVRGLLSSISSSSSSLILRFRRGLLRFYNNTTGFEFRHLSGPFSRKQNSLQHVNMTRRRHKIAC